MSKKSKQPNVPNGHDIAKIISAAYPKYFDAPNSINVKVMTINFDSNRRALIVGYKTHTRATQWENKQSPAGFSSNLITALGSLNIAKHENSVANVICDHLEIPFLKAMNEGIDKHFVISFSVDEIYFRCDKTKDFITIPFELSSVNLDLIRSMF